MLHSVPPKSEFLYEKEIKVASKSHKRSAGLTCPVMVVLYGNTVCRITKALVSYLVWSNVWVLISDYKFKACVTNSFYFFLTESG